MPYSALIFRDLPPEIATARATIVVLHGANGGLDDLVPLGRSLGPDLRVVAPEAARGVYDFRDLVAHTWYGGWHVDRPEPASFGDSLAQLERFVHDVCDRAAEGELARPWLLGYDQGAVLALCLATVAPELIAGVLAIRGCLPTFSRPDLFTAIPSALPMLLVGERDESSPPVAAVEATAARLAELGMRVTTTWVADARLVGTELGRRIVELDAPALVDGQSLPESPHPCYHQRRFAVCSRGPEKVSGAGVPRAIPPDD